MRTAKKVKEYPSELAKWVFRTACEIMDSRGKSRDVVEACRLAVAIVAFPEKFSVSDHVSLVFDSAMDEPESSAGFAGRRFKVRVSIKSTGVKIYWDNESFDTFVEPQVHEYDKGHWQYTSESDDNGTFDYCRDNHFYCCNTLCKAVAFYKGKRQAWSL